MDNPLKPVYLLADSQLLFWNIEGRLWLDSVKEQLIHPTPKAAYVGASNGDDPRFYSIFEAAMEGIGIRDCRLISSSFLAADEEFMNEAGLILLAGGDVERGWRVFTETGLKDLIIKKYCEGAVLIGISAGAIQLGVFGLAERENGCNLLIDTFKIVPFMIGAHEEGTEWKSLQETILLSEGKAQGIGIPTGGGMIYYPDLTVEAIRHPLDEFIWRDGVISHSLLFPKQE
jgi:hypothetical protein